MRIIVADDASGPEHLAALRRIEGIEIVEGEHNAGFSANLNRGLRAADPAHDVVILNSDVIPLRGWLASLQYASEQDPRRGIIARQAAVPQPAHPVRRHGPQRDAPDWYDHRHRGRPAAWGPANVAGPTLAATAAAMYVRRAVLDAIGPFDEAYPMGFEDVDYSLRAWQAGFEVHYAPSAQLHPSRVSHPRLHQGERELTSQRVFWERWRSFIDERTVLTGDGRLRVRYVTEDTIVGGGHRVVFEQLNGLADRGHDVELWTLGPAPGWFELRCPVRTFADYAELRPRWPGEPRSRSRPGGGPPCRSGARAWCMASRSTSSRTSRPATTRTRRERRTRCSTPTGPSSATSPPRGGIATGWRNSDSRPS